MKQGQHGLIIGKFMPPHQGHLHLISEACSTVEHLTLILFSKPDEPIPGVQRLNWLQQLCPNQHILHITNEYSVDYHSEDAWQFWIETIRAVYPAGPDVVFSSEGYGPELARRLGAKHEMVDLPRQTVPVSATVIRRQPFRYWGYIPPIVAPYFAKGIALVGAESTGKTTLAQKLGAYFNTSVAPEYARTYLEGQNRDVTPADMTRIIQGQAKEEQLARSAANRIFICDTDLLTTCIWYERYWHYVPDSLRKLSEATTKSLYLVLPPDVPWVADGLRDSEPWRDWMHTRLLLELDNRGANYQVLSGSFTDKEAQAIEAIEQLIAAFS